MKRIIKICGLKDPELALAAAEAGATHIGYVFAPSKRRVDPAQARRCIESVKTDFPDVISVGLFVEAAFEEVTSVAIEAGVDLLQLPNQSASALIKRLSLAVLPVIQTTPGETVSALIDYYTGVSGQGVHAVLLDAFHPSKAGGTGHLADWTFAAEAARSVPIVLAGGLKPENVSEAIRRVQPLGVDVSSGVEVDGTKNIALIQAFVRQAKIAFEELDQSIKTGASSQEAP